MSPDEFRLLRGLVHAHCGLSFREELGFIMERRLAPRLQALSLASFSDYHRFLCEDPGRGAELALAVELLVTNETYFFREPNQLRAFSAELLPALAREHARERRLRIWSAGCSTGDECYTLAILIQESGLFRGWEVRILGTDISRRVLAVAQAASYAGSALRATSEGLRHAYFRFEGGRYLVRDEVRALCDFAPQNLLAGDGGPPGEVEVVFCRNVMIYFDKAARQRLLASFHRRLVSGGYLLLGHSEGLFNLATDFELVHLENDLAYRRPGSVVRSAVGAGKR